MNKPSISVVKIAEYDRAGDGNLTPDAREKAKSAVVEFIREAGRVNVSELARYLGISRPTTRVIVDEVLAELRAEMEDQTVVIHQWCEDIVKNIDTHPEQFDRNTIARVRLKISFLDKMRTLRKSLRHNGG
ncbi:MAG: hypothetical protein WCF77_00045 [Minisyncoccia bacterium]